MKTEDPRRGQDLIDEWQRSPHIAVDFDGTLVTNDVWMGCQSAGAPVWPIIMAVRRALERGWRVSIFTARVSPREGVDADVWGSVDDARQFIEDWCVRYIGQRLPVTATKYGYFTEFWDDRATGIDRGCVRITPTPCLLELIDQRLP